MAAPAGQARAKPSFRGGRERTNAEYGGLLAAAGLRPGQIQPVAPPYGVIEGLSP